MSVPGGPDYPPPSTGPGEYPPPPPVPGGAGTLAEWWRRALAFALDALIISIPLGIISLVMGLAEFVSAAEGRVVRYEVRPALQPLSFLVWLAYFGLFEGSGRGASLGKMALRIQVRDASGGGPIGIGRAVLRRFVFLVLFYVFVIPGLINVLSPLWDHRRQAWHDKAANTVVVIAP